MLKAILKNKALQNLFAMIVILLTIYFFGRTIVANWEKVKEIGFRFNGYSVIALGLFSFAVMISGILWGEILKKLDEDSHKVPTLEFIRVHIGSWLLKYIPGQAGSFLGKINWSRKYDISKKKVTTSFLYENIFLVLSSFFLSAPILIVASASNITENLTAFLPLIVVFPALVILNKNLFYKLINFGLSKVKNMSVSEEYFLETVDMLKFLVKFSIPRIINAIGFIFIAVSLFEVDTSIYLILGASYILAGIIGLLAFFVPSGIGVREGIIVILLNNYMSSTEAIILSFYTRFFSTLSDIILTGIYLYIIKVLKK